METKEIFCTKCKCTRIVPINWNRKMCPKCTAKQQAKYKKRKAERKKRKDAERDRNWRIGVLNEPDARLEDFMSWERFQEFWGENVKMKTYIKEKEKFMEDQRRQRRELQPSDTDSIIMNVPLDPNRREACIKNRRMFLGLIRKDAFDIQNHCSCRWCKVWKKRNKSSLLLGGVTGLDLWRSGI